MVPSKSEGVPSVARPATCQVMFLAVAPPLRRTFLAALRFRSPAIWKIQTSPEPPARVTSVGMVTLLVHLYRPGASVRAPTLPAPSSVLSGPVRPAASVYAACILPIAAVRFAGVGAA